MRERRERLTPTESQEALLEALEEAVEELLGADVAAVGIGVPSIIDRTTGRALGSVNIPLGDVDLDDRLRARFGLPVAIENDANAAAFAEWRFGAGQGASSMVMLTLGTGVGGGVVFGGQLMRGLAEFGHIVIEHDGRPCQGTCTGRGHLEAYVSGTAATVAARAAFGPAADAYRLVRLGNEGDAQAIGILREIGERLGSGIGTLVNVFDPELVVIGGGFAAGGRPDPRAGASGRPPRGDRTREGARPGRPGQARHGGRDRRGRARWGSKRRLRCSPSARPRSGTSRT